MATEMTHAATHFKTVLVIGGAGFLGVNIVRKLLAHHTGPSTSIVVVGRHAASASALSGSAGKETDGRRHFAEVNPQVVFHTASASNVSGAAVLNQTNVEGTTFLLKHATQSPSTKAFVFTSSDSAQRPSQLLITEEEAQLWDDMVYNNPYGRPEAPAERLVLAANGLDLRTATLRIPIVCGEWDENFTTRAMTSLRKGEYRTQLGQNTKLFEYCYIRSAAAGHVQCASALLRTSDGQTEPKVNGETYFLTDDRSMPLFDFMRKCYAAAGAPVKPEEVTTIPLGLVQMMASAGEWAYWIFTSGTRRPAMRRQEIDHLDGGAHWSMYKARQRLGYEPIVAQDVAIERTVKWTVERGLGL